MYIYFANILIVLFASFMCKYKVKWIKGQIIDGNKIYGIIVFLSFSFIMAFRDFSVGIDTIAYSEIFTNIANRNSIIDVIWNEPLTEPLYGFLCRIISYISTNPRIIIVVTSLIINIGLIILVNKASTNAPVSYLSWIGLTLFYCSMNGTRQCIALVMSLYALTMLSENMKDKRAWFLLVLATLVHATAIVMLIAIAGVGLANRINDNKKLFIISGIASLLIAFAYGVGVRIILQFVPKYSIYVSYESKYSIFKGTGGGRIVFLYLVLLGITVVWMLKTHSINKLEKGFAEKVFPAVLFGAIFGIVNCKNELINRLLWYYLGIYVLFIPSVLSKYKKNKRMLLTIGIVTILMVYSFLSLKENQNGVVPYRFAW